MATVFWGFQWQLCFKVFFLKASMLFSFCSGTQTRSFLVASFCWFHGTKNYPYLWLLLAPPCPYLACSALFRLQWLVGCTHPSPSRGQLGWEPGLRTGVQPNRGTVSTGTNGAGKGQLLMRGKMVLPPWICSLGCAVSFMNWKRKEGNVECSVNLACELLVWLENFLPLRWHMWGL